MELILLLEFVLLLELILLLFLVELLVLLIVELLLRWLESILIFNWRASIVLLLLGVLFLEVLSYSLLVLYIRCFLLAPPVFILSHARLDGLPHHFIFFCLLLFPLLVELLACCKRFLHECFLLLTLSLLSHSQCFFQFFIL